MDIKEIREALERLNGFTYHAADNQDAEDIKTVCAALSTIDPEVIRAEARAEAFREATEKSGRSIADAHITACTHSQPGRSYALEPKIIGVGCHRRCLDCGNVFFDDDSPMAKREKNLDAIRAEVERKIKERDTREGLLYKSDVDDRG